MEELSRRRRPGSPAQVSPRWCANPPVRRVGWTLVGRRGGAGGTELEELHVTVGGDEDVRRLEVRVDDAAAVRGDERIGELDPELDHAIRRQRALGFDHLVQRAPFEQLADEERLVRPARRNRGRCRCADG